MTCSGRLENKDLSPNLQKSLVPEMQLTVMEYDHWPRPHDDPARHGASPESAWRRMVGANLMGWGLLINQRMRLKLLLVEASTSDLS